MHQWLCKHLPSASNRVSHPKLTPHPYPGQSSARGTTDMSTLDVLQVLQGNPLLRLVVFILNLLGWTSLTALLITVNFSEKIRRHTVFINFLCTWCYIQVMASLCACSFLTMVMKYTMRVGDIRGLASFSLVASYTAQSQSPGSSSHAMGSTDELTDLAIGLFETTLRDVLWMMSVASHL
jgi:hypothetical protein